MFNFLCGHNVTPNFSVGDLGKKNSALHAGIYSMFLSFKIFGASYWKIYDLIYSCGVL